MTNKRRAKATSPTNRRGSRRAVWDLVLLDGVPHAKRRARSLKRAAARVQTDRVTRKQMHEYVRLGFLMDKAQEEEEKEARRSAERFAEEAGHVI